MTDLLVSRMQVASLLEGVRTTWTMSGDTRGAHLVFVHPVDSTSATHWSGYRRQISCQVRGSDGSEAENACASLITRACSARRCAASFFLDDLAPLNRSVDGRN